MGRKKLYHERKLVALSKGTLKRIKKVLGKHEDISSFIRTWVEYGIEFVKLREKASSPPTHSGGHKGDANE